MKRAAMPPATLLVRNPPPLPRDVTAIVAGDPPPGRSALDGWKPKGTGKGRPGPRERDWL